MPSAFVRPPVVATPVRWSMNRAGAVAVGTVVAGSALFGGAPAVSVALSGPTQHEVTLTALSAAGSLSSSDAFLKFVLDYVFWIGQRPLPDLVTVPFLGSPTLGWTLNIFGLSTEDQLSTLFADLGFDKFTLGDILDDLRVPAGDTVNDVLHQLGLADTTLNQLLGGFGLAAGSTMLNLIDNLGMGDITLGTLLGEVGILNTTTVGDIFGTLGLYGLQGLLPALGIDHNTTIYDALAGWGLGPGQTLDQFLGPDGFAELFGAVTLGRLLGFKASTTLQDVVDGMHYNVDGTLMPLGQVTVEQLLNQLQLDATKPFGELLSGLQVGPGTLGDQTIGQALDLLLQPGQTAVSDNGVDNATTLAELLTGIGLGQMTLDQFLGLDPL